MKPEPSRIYVRSATGVWHEVFRAGYPTVTTFCGREFREPTHPGPAQAYESRTSWPPHGRAKACAPCRRKALARRRA